MGTVVQLKNKINNSYLDLKSSVEDKLVLVEDFPNKGAGRWSFTNGTLTSNSHFTNGKLTSSLLFLRRSRARRSLQSSRHPTATDE